MKTYKKILVSIFILCSFLTCCLSQSHAFFFNKKKQVSDMTKDESPLRAQWLYNKGNQFSNAGEYQQAVEYYKQAYALNTKDYDIQYNLATSYLHIEDYSNAINMLKRLSKQYPEDLNILYNLALSYQLAEEYQTALKLYSKILEKEPLYQKAYNNMGIIYTDLDELENAEVSFEQALEIDNNSPIVLYNLGKILIKKGQFTEAINLLEHIKSKIALPQQVILQDLAKSYHSAGLYDKAVETYEELITVYPGSYDSILYLAKSYAGVSMPARALELLSTVPRNTIPYYDAQLEMGKIYFEQKDYDKALQSFFAVFVENKSAEVADYIGQVFYSMSKFENAENRYLEALEIDKDYYKSLYHLGLVYFQTGHHAKAKEVFTKAIELSPDLSEVYVKLAKIYRKENKLNKAVDILISGLEHDAYPELMFELANIYAEKGDYRFAMNWYKKLLKTDQKVRAQNAIAAMFIQQGEYEKAQSLLSKIVDEGEYDADVYVNLGILAVKMNRTADAIHYFQKSLQLKPQDSSIFFNLALLYYNQNQNLNAQEMLKKCLELDPYMSRASILLSRVDKRLSEETI